jgi:signal peptidase I
MRAPSGLLWRGVRFAASAVVAGVLLYLGSLFFVTVGPRLAGWQAATIRSESMAPELRTGDIVLIVPTASRQLRVGDVVRFADPQRPDRHILHRVLTIMPDGTVLTKGDANPGADSTPLSPEQIHGVARLHIPTLGLPVEWARDQPFTAGGLTIAVAVAMTISVGRRRARRPNGRRTAAIVLSGTAGLFIASTLAWQTTAAAYVGTTTNPSNAWTAGAVSISDDDGGNSPTTGVAMFNVLDLSAADPAANKCITVTYTGNIAALVKLYGTNLSGPTLAGYLNLTIEMGTGGGYGSCTGFTPSATLYTGTLGGFGTSHTSYANGLTTAWTPTTNGQQKVFRITYSLQNDPAAIGLASTADLVWEAQG